MARRHHPLVLVFTMLLIATLACSLGGRKDIPLGETLTSDQGGFALKQVPEYETQDFWGMVIMMAPDAQEDVGPFIMAFGGLTEEDMSSQEILDQMQAEAENIEFAKPKNTKVDGRQGLLVEFSGEESGQTLKGKVFAVAPYPMQEFYITALAPESRWKELEPIFDAVLKSVTFFEAQPFEFDLDDWEWDEPLDDEAWESLDDEVASGESFLLGEVYQHSQGGFTFQKVAGYDFEDDFGFITMTQPGLGSSVRPKFSILYQKLPQPMTKEELFDNPFGTGSPYYNPTPFYVDGVEGLMMELEETKDGETIRGLVFLTMLTPYDYLNVNVESSASEWPGVRPIFEALLASIKFGEGPAGGVSAPGQVIRQWAVWAEASSEYTSGDWSAMQATGAPDVDVCGDDPLAWASTQPDTEEYLVLYYETPVNPTELVIHQSHNPSQVVEIQLIDTTGETWLLWYGDPETVEYCPDVWTHTIELDEVFYTDTVVIWVDQSVLGLGWVEIDAVELVGYPQGVPIAPIEDQPPAQEPPSGPTVGNVPTNYSGLMAGPVYQGWVNIIIGETLEADLDRIMTIPGSKSTDSWKPRESHKQTYLYDMPWAGMTAYISVTTDGWVYKKNVTANTHADDFALATVTRETYEQLKAIYDRDKVIPYEVMANMLGSPGFLREQWIGEDDGIVRSTYNWYNASGDRITGIFLDGRLTGIMGLNFIEAN